jgi:hypothetical protein
VQKTTFLIGYSLDANGHLTPSLAAIFLHPDYTRSHGFAGAAGVVEKQKTSEKPRFFSRAPLNSRLLYR